MNPLDEETERLNRAFEGAERALADLSLGVRGAVPMSDGIMLVFGKNEKTWRLGAQLADGGWIPLASASRRLRTEAASKLPELLSAMRSEAVKQLPEVTKAADEVERFVRELREQPAEPAP